MESFKKRIAAALKKSLKKLGLRSALNIQELLESPPDPALGDLAFPCFSFAKELKKSPAQIAVELASSLAPPAGIQTIVPVGPYINFFLSASALAKMALEKPAKVKKTKERIVLEYVSPNTNKPLHLGHVRNAVLGDSVARILMHAGKKVIRTCLVNDRGIHICKSMIAYMIQGIGYRDQGLEMPTPARTGKKGDHFVGDYYVLFEQMFQKDESLAQTAQECLKKWEQGDRKTRALWKKMNGWVLAGMKETYRRLDISFNKTYFESGMYDKGKDIILSELKKGVVKKDETGAVYADLSAEKLPNKVLLRRDGTALYITQDIFLAKQKIKDFRASSSIYVIGSEQNLYLEQLFSVLMQFGYPWAKNLFHLSYGMVNLPEGKMKSREGTVVDADDILDDLERMATEKIIKRDQVITKKEIGRRAKVIAGAAIKFYMADVSPKSDMTYDPKASIALSGRTGPYILYTYARLKSILRKVSKTTKKKTEEYGWQQEKPIALQLLSFEDTLANAARELNPSLICQYSFSLAQKVNDYYHKTPVLNAVPSERACRVALIARTADTLKQSLALLGIKVLEKM